MAGVVRIELFDGLRAVVGATVITRFRTQKTAALLAYLAYTLPRRHARETLIELIWPECEPAAGRHNLSNALSSLRAQLEPSGVATGTVLVVDRNSVSLDPAQVSVDAVEFQGHLERARRAGGPQERATALAAAVALYQGELLRGQYDDWLFPEQARLAAAHARALRELAVFHEDAGDLDTSIEYASRAVALDPLCEESCRRLMGLYAAAGQPSLALGHYREYQRRLERELDAAPGPELRELAHRLVQPRPVRSAVSETDSASEASERPASLEPVGGAVPLHSQLYVSRETDAEFEQAISRGESIVLVKGPRQSGKTSLLARGVQRARQLGAQVALTDLQTLSERQLETADGVLFALAESLADQLDLEVRPRSCWDVDRGPSLCIRRYLRREVLGRIEGQVVWALDEVDRLMGSRAGDQVFALFRSWHNERALDPQGPWMRLTLAMAYATEAHLFIADLSQSPFNVGIRLELQDFSLAQVSDLNDRYGQPLSQAELEPYFALLGGHPYLVRRGLHEMARRGIGFSGLRDLCEAEVGVFSDHIQRLVNSLSRDPAMRETVQAVLSGQPCTSDEAFARLRSAGVLTGESARQAQFRCLLYRQVLPRALV